MARKNERRLTHAELAAEQIERALKAFGLGGKIRVFFEVTKLLVLNSLLNLLRNLQSKTKQWKIKLAGGE